MAKPRSSGVSEPGGMNSANFEIEDSDVKSDYVPMHEIHFNDLFSHLARIFT